jgi:transposase
MLTEKKAIERDTLEIMCTEMLVPKEHLLRKIDAAVDFRRIYEIVGDLYCKDNGRPSIDPIVLFKIVLIQHLYGIRSLRQTVSEIEMNIAYRWFLGYRISEPIPHFATVSYNFRHRFNSDTVERIFCWILDEVNHAGYLSPEVVYIDGTHVKANANMKKQVKRAIPVAAKAYEKQLREEVNADREEHGKKPFDDDPPGASAGGTKKKIATSKTDPDCGVFHKGDHKKCFAYSVQTACDGHNYILGVDVHAGNKHDSVAFDSIYEQVAKRFPEIGVVTLDAGYKTPWICKKIIEDGRIPSMPYKRPMTKTGNHAWWKYVYDEYYDCVICPEYNILNYSTTNKKGYREYKSDPNVCKHCPTRHICTASKQCQKLVSLHIWRDFVERAEDIRHTPLGKQTYARRKETIERIFADAKEKHAMRYTPYRGLTAVSNWVKLKYAAMNLKKLAIHSWEERLAPLWGRIFMLLQSFFYAKNPIPV